MRLFLFLVSILITAVSFGQATANFWAKKNDFSGGKRERAVSFTIGEYGYIGTGIDTAEQVLKDLWRYDPSADTWQQMADMPTPNGRRDAIGFSLGNKGYIGTGIDNDFSFMGSKLKDFWEFNPLANTWIQKSDFPGGGGNGIYFAASFAVDSKGYICGGKIGPNFYSAQLWEYKPSIDQWVQRAPFPGGVRYQLSAFSIGNYGFVGLGANQDVFKRDFWKYNPGTNQWQQIADLPASERGGAVTFTIEDRGFVCMGTNGGLLDDLWEYNPVTNQWSPRAFYGGSERKNATGFVVNGKAYVGTGKGYSGKKQGMEEYTPHNFLGMDEFENISFNLYPNPTSDFLNCLSPIESVNEFSLLTISGELLESIENTVAMPRFDLRTLEKGVYLVYGKSADGRVLATEKIILF
jgi:N-acetylneuraminic acid mutarotase